METGRWPDQAGEGANPASGNGGEREGPPLLAIAGKGTAVSRNPGQDVKGGGETALSSGRHLLAAPSVTPAATLL